MIYDNADEVIEYLIESLLNGYQIGLETSMRGSNFIFDCVHLLCCKCHKIKSCLMYYKYHEIKLFWIIYRFF